jgi:predicted acylesterase/phospholipase RssA/ABC-type phosphate/phosphonate transport system substrate-binding protein
MVLPQPTTRTYLARLTIACLLLLFAFAHQNTLSKPAKKVVPKPEALSQAPLVLRVGAIYYDDSDEHYEAIKAVLSELEKQAQASPEQFPRAIVFKLAVGTYDEVMNWYESDQIDLAIMNPGPLALLLKKYSHEELDNLLVGIRGNIPPKTSVAGRDAGPKPTARSKYNSIMLLNRDAIRKEFPSPGKQPTDAELIHLVTSKAKQKNAHFLFVHPLSTSGYIFPRKFLDDNDVKLDLTDYDITYSHDVSTKQIEHSGYDSKDRFQVAFVSDETRDIADNTKVRAIRLDQEIVQDALLLTPDFVQRESIKDENGKESTTVESVKKLLRSTKGKSAFNLSTPPKWWTGYKEVESWIDTFGGDTMVSTNELTIDQIITRINNYNRHHPNPKDRARVALVLSGGGAKCAYQLGAVGVIEDELEAAQKANPSQELGIDLVVGTSGGAINALTIAAEVTRDQNKRSNLVSTWQGFGQSEILKPSNFVRRLLGLTLGLILSLCILCALYLFRLIKWLIGFGRQSQPKPTEGLGTARTPWRRVRDRIARLTLAERTGVILLILALVFFLAGQRQITLTSRWSADTLLRQHVFVHIAEYSRQPLRWAALALLFCGVALCVDSFISRRRPGYASLSREGRPVVVMAAVLLSVILPVFTLYRVFISEKSLFVSEGIVEKVGVEMPKLLGLDGSSRSLPDLSRDIIQQGLIKRNLVITGSMLQTPSDSSSTESDNARRLTNDDTDLYFVYKAGTDAALPPKLLKDNRFVSLRDPDNETILLDAVIGSGAIFPAFEPRKLSGVKRVMDKSITKDVSIIDGGFVHNSPIEAAVKLDATHIIVIEASPQSHPNEEVNLVNNSVAAFNHLFTQAQLLDARSRRQAEIFTLQPASPTEKETPFLCTLDFGKNFITHAIECGMHDASDTVKPRFVRQPRPSGL